jgi:hypothetical protein
MRNVILCLLAACDAGAPKLAPPAATPPVTGPAIIAPADAAALDAPVAVTDALQWPPKELDLLFAMPRAMTTADGTFVLFAVSEDSGARGDPSLAFEIHDRRDRLVGKRVTVLGLDEAPDDPTRPARIAAAQALIASHPFVAMTALPRAEVLDGEHYAEHEQYADTGTVVEWLDGTLAITLPRQPIVQRKAPASWYVADYYMKSEDLTCHNPPFLAGAYVGPASAKLVVVDVAYRGNDTCWEPGAKPHVVAL